MNLYIVIYFDENKDKDKKASMVLLEKLGLPYFHYPPAVMVAFSGSKDELSALLQIDADHYKGIVSEVMGLMIFGDQEDSAVEWVVEKIPRMRLIT